MKKLLVALRAPTKLVFNVMSVAQAVAIPKFFQKIGYPAFTVMKHRATHRQQLKHQSVHFIGTTINA
jgi:hypothetical protein